VWASRRFVTSVGRGTARIFTVDCLLDVHIVITSLAFSVPPSYNKYIKSNHHSTLHKKICTYYIIHRCWYLLLK
jgi:hypothetical protein